ncbi:hypothetical protein ROA7450_03856 [Roseovarius albus]|uniref:Uncharacterized protein n=1 Tax=Roseovarius albus TaxID=1247867 RepID=A0A1X7A4V5_9RHOB|nr:hypothetical protein [Roseovarius albus]SLN70755.1 hypothetical protein ROA7450_03856 [Roseovarius albus]
MSKKKNVFTYQGLDHDSDEFDELFHKIIPLMERYFTPEAIPTPRQNAAELINRYDEVMLDFWSRDQASKALTDLQRSISSLADAYARVPTLVIDRLEIDVRHCDYLQKEGFLKQTKLDIIFNHMLPEPGASLSYDALKVLATHFTEFIPAIEMTRRELPEGIPTRNRSKFNEWALIDATVHIVRKNKLMNVPAELDNSGELGRLLRDVFAAFGIEKNSFKTVYRSWREYMDGKYQNYDLMTI